MRGKLALTALAMTLSCAGGSPGPAALDTKTEICRFCRMPVSDARLAAQLVARGEEPRFFDDLGCLRGFLARSRPSPGTVAYVADHGTRGWVRAADAVYTRARIETPMGSHWIAHTDAASRDRDPASQNGAPIALREIFGVSGPPDGR